MIQPLECFLERWLILRFAELQARYCDEKGYSRPSTSVLGLPPAGTLIFLIMISKIVISLIMISLIMICSSEIWVKIYR